MCLAISHETISGLKTMNLWTNVLKMTANQKIILVGTSRPNSYSLKVAKAIQSIHRDLGIPVPNLLNLADLEFPSSMAEVNYSKESISKSVEAALQVVNQAQGIIFVVPEYNGSFPGVLKLFIDHWAYPLSFEFRPVCYVGLGNRFGGLRPIEHLQGVMGYRNAYQLPQRVFLMNVSKLFTEGTSELKDELTIQLLKDQALEFSTFCDALGEHRLSALHRGKNQI